MQSMATPGSRSVFVCQPYFIAQSLATSATHSFAYAMVNIIASLATRPVVCTMVNLSYSQWLLQQHLLCLRHGQ